MVYSDSDASATNASGVVSAVPPSVSKPGGGRDPESSVDGKVAASTAAASASAAAATVNGEAGLDKVARSSLMMAVGYSPIAGMLLLSPPMDAHRTLKHEPNPSAQPVKSSLRKGSMDSRMSSHVLRSTGSSPRLLLLPHEQQQEQGLLPYPHHHSRVSFSQQRPPQPSPTLRASEQGLMGEPSPSLCALDPQHSSTADINSNNHSNSQRCSSAGDSPFLPPPDLATTSSIAPTVQSLAGLSTLDPHHSGNTFSTASQQPDQLPSTVLLPRPSVTIPAISYPEASSKASGLSSTAVTPMPVLSHLPAVAPGPASKRASIQAQSEAMLYRALVRAPVGSMIFPSVAASTASPATAAMLDTSALAANAGAGANVGASAGAGADAAGQGGDVAGLHSTYTATTVAPSAATTAQTHQRSIASPPQGLESVSSYAYSNVHGTPGPSPTPPHTLSRATPNPHTPLMTPLNQPYSRNNSLLVLPGGPADLPFATGPQGYRLLSAQDTSALLTSRYFAGSVTSSTGSARSHLPGDRPRYGSVIAGPRQIGARSVASSTESRPGTSDDARGVDVDATDPSVSPQQPAAGTALVGPEGGGVTNWFVPALPGGRLFATPLLRARERSGSRAGSDHATTPVLAIDDRRASMGSTSMGGVSNSTIAHGSSHVPLDPASAAEAAAAAAAAAAASVMGPFSIPKPQSLPMSMPKRSRSRGSTSELGVPRTLGGSGVGCGRASPALGAGSRRMRESITKGRRSPSQGAGSAMTRMAMAFPSIHAAFRAVRAVYLRFRALHTPLSTARPREPHSTRSSVSSLSLTPPAFSSSASSASSSPVAHVVVGSSSPQTDIVPLEGASVIEPHRGRVMDSSAMTVASLNASSSSSSSSSSSTSTSTNGTIFVGTPTPALAMFETPPPVGDRRDSLGGRRGSLRLTPGVPVGRGSLGLDGIAAEGAHAKGSLSSGSTSRRASKVRGSVQGTVVRDVEMLRECLTMFSRAHNHAHEWSNDTIRSLFQQADLSNSSAIDMREFVVAVAIGHLLEVTNPSKELAPIIAGFKVVREAFDSLAGESGTLTKEDFRAVMSEISPPNLVEARFRELDFNDKGVVDFPKFLHGVVEWVGLSDDECDLDMDEPVLEETQADIEMSEGGSDMDGDVDMDGHAWISDDGTHYDDDDTGATGGRGEYSRDAGDPSPAPGLSVSSGRPSSRQRASVTRQRTTEYYLRLASANLERNMALSRPDYLTGLLQTTSTTPGTTPGAPLTATATTTAAFATASPTAAAAGGGGGGGATAFGGSASAPSSSSALSTSSSDRTDYAAHAADDDLTTRPGAGADPAVADGTALDGKSWRSSLSQQQSQSSRSSVISQGSQQQQQQQGGNVFGATVVGGGTTPSSSSVQQNRSISRVGAHESRSSYTAASESPGDRRQSRERGGGSGDVVVVSLGGPFSSVTPNTYLRETHRRSAGASSTAMAGGAGAADSEGDVDAANRRRSDGAASISLQQHQQQQQQQQVQDSKGSSYSPMQPPTLPRSDTSSTLGRNSLSDLGRTASLLVECAFNVPASPPKLSQPALMRRGPPLDMGQSS